MLNFRKVLGLSAVCAGLLLFANSARAQGIIRFVASYGNDANPCTRTAPCRSMQAGVNATPEGSELQVLDSAGYGATVSITKTITISADGVQATIATPSGAGININAPGKTVVLRHLRLMGTPATLSGIVVADANVVRIENCVIEGFGNNGIRYTSTNGGQLHVTNTIASNNTDNGMRLEGPCPCLTTIVSVTGSSFTNNGRNGIALSDGVVRAAIIDTMMSGNAEEGLSAGSLFALATVNCDRCTASDNGSDGFHAVNGSSLNISHSVARGNLGSGVEARSGAFVRVSDSTSTDNVKFGFRQHMGATFETIGNNLVRGNSVDVSGTVTNVGGI